MSKPNPFDPPERLLTPRVLARLAGEPHRHHRDCIHNLSPEEQIAARGRTREWWEAMGFSMPKQITPNEWEEG
jgi:hypothetical protein